MKRFLISFFITMLFFDIASASPAVYVEGKTSDPLGAKFINEVKEQVRIYSGMQLSKSEEDSVFQIHIVTTTIELSGDLMIASIALTGSIPKYPNIQIFLDHSFLYGVSANFSDMAKEIIKYLEQFFPN